MNSKQSAKFTIVHITDPHWICKDRLLDRLAQDRQKIISQLESIDQKAADAKSQTAEAHLKIVKIGEQQDAIRKETDQYEKIRSCYESINLKEYLHGSKSILIHTGDTANFYDYHKRISIGEQFAEIERNFFDLMWPNITFDEKIALPGNHDIARTKMTLEEANEKERCKDFADAFKGWKTPFTHPSVRVEHNNLAINFWLINSARHCGLETSPDGRNIDIIEIFADQIKQWKSDLKAEDKMRIALLHHNPLPNYGVIKEIRANEVFRNNGNFNAEVVKTNVKLVLSGHQHLGDELYAAMPRRVYAENSLGGLACPMIECGFLSSSAPTFLRHNETDVKPGFNIIQIELSSDDNIARININQVRYDPEAEKSVHGFPYRIALKRLKDVKLKELKQAEEEEQYNRIQVLDTITSRVYNESSIEPLQRVLHLTSKVKAVDDLVSQYKDLRDLYKDRRDFQTNVFGIYSISVMSPDSWWAHDITTGFIEPFIDYSKGLGTRKAGTGNSRSLRAAATTALSNIAAIKSALEYHQKASTAHHQFVMDMKQSPLKGLEIPDEHSNCATFSKVGQACAKNEFILTKEVPLMNGWDFDQSVPHSMLRQQTSDGFEMARIVYWPLEYFRSEYALSVIYFHEAFSVPLFWLNPHAVKGRVNVRSQKRAQRKRLGTFLVRSFSDTDLTLEPTLRTPMHCFINNEYGLEPKPGEYYDSTMNLADPFQNIVKLWGQDVWPKRITRNVTHPIATEIALLLRRPDLYFAADVWALYRMNCSELLIDYNNSKSDELCHWADSE